MKKDLKIILRAFAYCTIVFGLVLGITVSIYSSEIISGFAAAFCGAIIFSTIMSTSLFFSLSMFRKRWFYYNNMDKKLREHNICNIYFESIAGDAGGLKIKHGALFLTKESLIFIPHRFAIKQKPIILPLDHIQGVKETGINIKKFFAGGLRNRLNITLKNGTHYEFSVWEIKQWIIEIRKRVTLEKKG